MGFNKHGISGDVTRQLSAYIKNTTFEDIPPAVVERAKNLLLHTLGVSLAALDLQQGKDALSIAQELSPGAAGEATLWGGGRKASLQAAAFLGGSLGDLLDWEDCAWTGHPSAGVIPAAVTAAEAFHKSGKELITAIVVGYEVYLRVAMSAGANINGLNIFAASVPIAKLADLDERQINQVLGAAAACSAIPIGPHETTMSDSLNYLYGLKAEGAVDIVETVRRGIENLEDTFDDPTSYVDHMRSATPEWFLRGLGGDYYLMQIMVKHWPANMYVQTYAELANRIREKHRIDPDNIERIWLEPSVEFRHYKSPTGYDSLTQAQFSIPYGIAAAFYHPVAGSVWYRPETLHDPRVVALMNKVDAEHFCDEAGHKPIPGFPHLRQLIEGFHPEKFMTVYLKNGTQVTESLFTHPGSPAYMFTREAFSDNFRSETAVVLTPAETEQIIAIVRDLENTPDAAVLGESLARAGEKEEQHAV